MRVGGWLRFRDGGVVCLEVEVVHVRLPVRRLDATYNVHEHAEPGHDDDSKDETHALLGGTQWGGSFDIPHRPPRRARSSRKFGLYGTLTRGTECPESPIAPTGRAQRKLSEPPPALTREFYSHPLERCFVIYRI